MVLIEKHYRGFLSRTICDQFWSEASANKNLRDTPPVIQKDKYVLAHVQVSVEDQFGSGEDERS